MKLSPKLSTFCPGCGHKTLELGSAPELIINTEKKDTKRITIFGGKQNKPKGGLF